MQDFNVYSPGHEGAGVIVKLGSQVKGWKVGDRAGVKPMWDVCHNCEQCWTGIEQWCRNRLNTGVEVTGTYQQYIVGGANSNGIGFCAWLIRDGADEPSALHDEDTGWCAR